MRSVAMPLPLAPQARPLAHDVTVRVGCSLVYEATGPATLLLNVQPRPERTHALLSESLQLGDGLPAVEFTDSHGNRIWKLELARGTNRIRHDAIVAASSQLDNEGLPPPVPVPVDQLPPSVLRYAFPSRYCDSDKLSNFAWEKFGREEHGWPRVQAISRWLHDNIEYRFLSGRPDLSAWDVLQRGYGVCRDFAHLAVALNRTFNLPARYATSHLPDIGFFDPGSPMDFHAFGEVYLGGHWFTTDARFHVPRRARIPIAFGQDAVDGAFSTIFGGAALTYFEAWAYQVPPGRVQVGDPIDLSLRLDGTEQIRTDNPNSQPGR